MNFQVEIKRTFSNWLKEVEFGKAENAFAFGCSVSLELLPSELFILIACTSNPVIKKKM